MKSQDITLIAVIAVFVTVLSAMLTNMVVAPADKLQQNVEVVQPISTEFKLPDERYFNAESNNPTRLIRITENENQNPFNNQQ